MQPKELSPAMQLANMSRWYVVSRGIHTIAQLGLANHMSNEPLDVQQLAKLSGTRSDMLERLLKFLSAYGLFKEENNCFALTPLSQPLRDDDPHSMRDVLRLADDSWWQAFSCIDQSLKSGESAFSHQHGDDFFSFLGNHPEKQHNFDRGMAKLSSYDDKLIVETCDLGQAKHLVDMGAGRGGLSQAFAKKYPQLAVTLFDTPAVINQLNMKDFPAQIRFESGDFMKEIPVADNYIFKGVLHDFNDELMLKILKNCKQRMPATASLIIAEQIMPESPGPHPNKTMDIVMMVLLAGRQRTLNEWKKSIEPAGFIFQEALPTNSLFTVMKFKPEPR